MDHKWEGTLDEACALIKGMKFDKGQRDHSQLHRPDFCRESFAATMKAAREGWQHGVADLQKIQDLIVRHEDAETTDYDRDVTGMFFDVGDVIQGIPECCFNRQMDRKQRPLTVHVNGSYSAHVNQDDITRRGAVVAEIVDRLREKGPVSVIVWLSGRDKYQIKITIDTENSYSKNVLTFALAHPGMLRRLGFAVIEHLYDHSPPFGYGMPGPVPVKEDSENLVFDHYAGGWSRGAMENYSNLNKAIATANKVIAEMMARDAEV